MLELWQFIFSDFWIWLGTFLFLAAIVNGIVGAVEYWRC